MHFGRGSERRLMRMQQLSTVLVGTHSYTVSAKGCMRYMGWVQTMDQLSPCGSFHTLIRISYTVV
jgi:hypothetical protein